MNRTPLRFAPLVAALALPLSAQTVTTTLLNDTFTDLDRTNQSLPDSSKWLTSASNNTDNIDASSGALRIKHGNTALTYFTDGAPVTLEVGESLTLSFTVSFSGLANGAANFRVGLYNSAGGRLTADNFQNNNSAFTGSYAGYIAGVNTGANSSNMFRVYTRGTATTLISGSIGTAYAQVGSGGGAYKNFIVDNIYSGTVTLSRIDESTMTITQAYSGLFVGDVEASTASATITDTASSISSFDTLAFYYHNTGIVTIDNLKLEYTSLASNIPEPASAAALLGAFALSAGALRRRRRA